MSKNLANPYRPFFFVGLFASLIGVSVWIATALIPSLPYPGRLHAHLMMGVFLLSYAIGFLMTALPRLTQTPTAHRYEFLSASLLMGWIVTVGIYDSTEKMFFVGTLATSIFIFFFGIRRFIRTEVPIPNFFPMLFWGIFSVFLGSILVLTGQPTIGTALFYQNFMLCLVLGIGTFLIPRILGIPQNPKIGNKWIFFILGLLLTLSLVLYEIYDYSWAPYLRAVLATGLVIFGWKITAKNERKNAVGVGIKIATTSTLIGLWVLAVTPQYRLEALHTIYITGFSLLTFMVASRVILSHGNYGLSAEEKNPYIKAAIFFICLAALTRIAAVFIPESYEKHLAYASVSFIIGATIWAKYFLPRIFENFGQLDS